MNTAKEITGVLSGIVMEDIMDKNTLINEIINYVKTSEGNFIGENTAIRPDIIGLKLFDDPLVGFADANDPCFKELKNDGIIGSNFMLPEEWNEKAITVISMFFPFTEKIRNANKENMDWPSPEWLHGRIEGQAFISRTCNYLKEYLENAGYKTIFPGGDSRFSQKSPMETDVNDERYFTSNWSERHVAYISGLGTFGLSKGLITAKGTAGRLGSLITEVYFEPDKRKYKKIYEYCSLCGKCAGNCPSRAITTEHGKLHVKCNIFLETVKEKHNPRYGCGKCQVNVPCEHGIPFLV
ncbi:MAG: 4Fe-4S binding protein [Treponema sp.]|nr:4Fe-4S binding protein [Treponema sp.]